MSGQIDKRKRSREDDVSCESTPLSKRINNLHLSNFEQANYNHLQQQPQPHHSNNQNNQIQQQLSKEMLTHQHAAAASSSTSTSSSGVPSTNRGNIEAEKATYDPELNKADNPFYYDKNKLLHELHLERLKRCSV